MTDQTDDRAIAEGVDDEPVEQNRRLFAGWRYGLIATLAAFYAVFHMLALNGVSVSAVAAMPWSIPAERAALVATEARQAVAAARQAGEDVAELRAASRAARDEARALRREARAVERSVRDVLFFLPRFPMETWNFRIIHIAGALLLGFLLFSSSLFRAEQARRGFLSPGSIAALAVLAPALIIAAATAIGFIQFLSSGEAMEMGGRVIWMSTPEPPQMFSVYQGVYDREIYWFGIPLLIATFGAIVIGWFERGPRDSIAVADIVLALCGVVVALYLIPIYGTAARNAVGTPNAPIGVAFAATAGAALILELTRRVAGLALVVITGVFLTYTFTAHLLPGVLAVDQPYTWLRFFGHIYSDAGILGPTTAVSSTYIILFIIFAAFLQASKVGDYFVNFAFAAAGRARGGPAKVAIFASGLMGMINGTSAGNVVATGSLTIPLMKKVGYDKKIAGAVEAGASTGGQIMPPIMGAGAFIMAEITGIPYTDIAIAAIIPAVLYFASIYFMVDFEAAKMGMRGMRADELPRFADMARRVFLFLPIIILIAALFAGYSVIRAGTYATAAAAVVSWLTPYRVGPKSAVKAFELAGIMSIQIIAVCACAGIIVGVISLTGVGARFSNLLLDLAGVSQLLALFFAMCIAILLGMGMPTTAAYAVAASVVAPGLVELGIPMLTAHFFVFYFAVISAITPPVALASYAAAGISGANPMATSVASFKIGIAAFVVPFMFFYNSALLMDGEALEIARALVTALIGVFLLSAGVQGWFLGKRPVWWIRGLLIAAALLLIAGGLVTDLAGVVLVVGVVAAHKMLRLDPDAIVPTRGAD